MKFSQYLSELLRSRQPRGKKARRERRNSRRLRLEALEDRRVPATFMVTNTNNSGPGSLTQAIFCADNTTNTNGVPDEIHFSIAGPGVHTIYPSTSLPHIIEAVIIDGYTQPGASPNMLAVGDNAVL